MVPIPFSPYLTHSLGPEWALRQCEMLEAEAGRGRRDGRRGGDGGGGGGGGGKHPVPDPSPLVREAAACESCRKSKVRTDSPQGLLHVV